ncbi:MAG: bifunctional tetrahydrofolate synthase/dihydrofolate synthase [Gammaproteobacteria bacterium]|nr:bifunctional tetrahydrofolate synthase/dihydrofolate synthase [Gammaproteobacteria bacterium]
MRFTSLPAWLAWQETLHPNAIDLGLERVRVVAQRMQLLQPAYVLITVGGTNGKGSSVAMLEAILLAAGYRVGAYTSPHLLRYNERVRVNGIEASDAQLCAAFAHIDAARGDTSLTYFEFGTLAALDIFSNAKLDIVVLEVGLGGQLDAVNILDADVALVTSVALDHTEWLGTDRDSIAREKAGIYRAGKPALFGEPDVPPSLQQHTRDIGAALYRYGTDFGARPVANGWSWWGLGKERHALVLPALRGAHQLQNAAGVLMALELLAERVPVTQAQIRTGLMTVALPGRFQVLPGPVTHIYDVAHNPHGAHALAQTLRTHPCSGRTFAVCGMLRDKDIRATLAELAAQVDAWYVAPVGSPRTASAEELVIAVHVVAMGKPVVALPDIATAQQQALADARDGDRIVVFGSFYTVAAALPASL